MSYLYCVSFIAAFTGFAVFGMLAALSVVEYLSEKKENNNEKV